MQRVEMSSVALTVFKKCYSWYKTSHMEQTTAFKEIEEHISVTSKEVVKLSSTTSTKTITESSKAVMREVSSRLSPASKPPRLPKSHPPRWNYANL